MISASLVLVLNGRSPLRRCRRGAPLDYAADAELPMAASESRDLFEPFLTDPRMRMVLAVFFLLGRVVINCETMLAFLALG